MIVIDTNVVSEVMKPQPETAVLEWLNAQPDDSLYLTCVTEAELLFGVATLVDGKRKVALARYVERLLQLFKDRLLAFDSLAAQHYAQLAAKARTAGKAFPLPDAYIAAIASSRDYAVASRDTGPYLAAGIDVVNPWS